MSTNSSKKKKRKLPRWKRKLRYSCWRVSKSMHLRERIEKGNEWASKNPKKFFRITVGILLVSLILTIIFSVHSILVDNNRNQKPLVGSNGQIENIQPMFDSLHHIEDNKKVIRSEVNNLTNTGLKIKNELDSLIELPVKTHEDSVLIYHDYKRLEDIVKFLKKGDKDEKD